MFDRISDSHDDETSDYYVNIALKNNGLISDSMFKMADYICLLEETIPEMNRGDKQKNRMLYMRQNDLFKGFRYHLRFVYKTTKFPVLVNKPTDFDKETIGEIDKYINEPYGSYPLPNILIPASHYIGILEKKGIVPVVLGYSVESSMKKWMKS